MHLHKRQYSFHLFHLHGLKHGRQTVRPTSRSSYTTGLRWARRKMRSLSRIIFTGCWARREGGRTLCSPAPGQPLISVDIFRMYCFYLAVQKIKNPINEIRSSVNTPFRDTRLLKICEERKRNRCVNLKNKTITSIYYKQDYNYICNVKDWIKVEIFGLN